MKNKNVLIVDFSNSVTGAFKSAVLMQKALQSCASVFIAIPKDSEIESEDYGSILRFRNSKIRRSLSGTVFYGVHLFLSVISVWRLVKSNRFDVVIVNDYDNFYAFFLRLFGWRGRIVSFVRRLPSSQPRFLSSIWLFFAYRSSDVVVSVSKAVLRQLPDLKKNALIYNSMSEISDYRERHEEESFSDTEVIKFLCVSNYMPGKGQRDVLLAFLEAVHLDSGLRLEFVGGDLGMKKNRYFRQCLEDEAQASGQSDKIAFSGFSDDIRKKILESHVLLNFSHAESFSRVCAEAAFYCRPIIATRCGGPEEIVVDQVTGFLVDVGDIDAMAKKILWFSKNPEHIRIMGENAKRIFEDRFSFAAFKDSIRRVVLGE